ncbi:MAG: dolichyl-phosphate beta-glucosyltransferase [Minisyncoccia bacterium]|jgi:dolichyl-phosphate beta-glucosyltransferase
MYLSVIIPAYNEADRIPKTLVAMDAYLSKVNYPYEILVVNDGSRDKTAEVVVNMAKVVKNLKLLDIKENHGKGSVVREGMLRAKGDIRLFMDADNSTSVDQVQNMLPFFKNGFGVVVGSRAVPGAKLEPAEPLLRQLAGKGLNLIVQALLLRGIWDTQCGFKAYTAEAAEKIFSVSRIVGWGFDVETIALAKKFGYPVKEMPVHWVNDTRSHVKLSGGLQFLRDIFKIRWWLWIGAYQTLTETLS